MESEKIILPYGRETVAVEIEEGHLAGVLRSGIHGYKPPMAGEELVRAAMARHLLHVIQSRTDFLGAGKLFRKRLDLLQASETHAQRFERLGDIAPDHARSLRKRHGILLPQRTQYRMQLFVREVATVQKRADNAHVSDIDMDILDSELSERLDREAEHLDVSLDALGAEKLAPRHLRLPGSERMHRTRVQTAAGVAKARTCD